MRLLVLVLALFSTGCMSIPIYLATGRYEADERLGSQPDGEPCGSRKHRDPYTVGSVTLYCYRGDECVSPGRCRHLDPDDQDGGR